MHGSWFSHSHTSIIPHDGATINAAVAVLWACLLVTTMTHALPPRLSALQRAVGAAVWGGVNIVALLRNVVCSSMRLVIQRATRGRVTVGGAEVASIGAGLVVLVGISDTDHEADLDFLARKLLALRLFDGADGTAWAASVTAAAGAVLLVSQFTLYGVPKGNKPDFHRAMGGDTAGPMFDLFVRKVRDAYKGGDVQTGVFGADMQVEIVNNGPVTLQLSTDDQDLSKERAKLDKAKAKYGGKHATAAAAGSAAAVAPASATVAAADDQSPAVDASAAKQEQSADATATAPAIPATVAVSPAAAAAVVAPVASVAPRPAAVSKPKPAQQRNRAAASPSASVLPAASPSPSAQSASGASVDAARSFSDLVGRTSLIRLRAISEATGCEVLGKIEYENPGGSIKDRPAVAILDAAEAAGQLVRGEPGWIVEGTAGNTGLGLALAGASRGYRTLVVLASNNSDEKKQALRAVGATLLEVPAVPFVDVNNYVHVARRVYESMRAAMPGVRVVLADQWSNAANRAAHFSGTGPEIWRQTRGKIDAFCCGVGTGGTLSGVGLYLRSRNPAVRIGLVDPAGSALKDFYERGALDSEGESVAEGIGQKRLCDNLTRGAFRPDVCLRVTDAEALPVAYALLAEEGISVGSSSAVNVAGALQLARRLGPGHTIVTVLCDSGMRYASKMANPAFLRSKGLPVPRWLDEQHEDTAATMRLAAQLREQALLTETPPEFAAEMEKVAAAVAAAAGPLPTPASATL